MAFSSMPVKSASIRFSARRVRVNYQHENFFEFFITTCAAIVGYALCEQTLMVSSHVFNTGYDDTQCVAQYT